MQDDLFIILCSNRHKPIRKGDNLIAKLINVYFGKIIGNESLVGMGVKKCMVLKTRT